jgi:hypothetical protein
MAIFGNMATAIATNNSLEGDKYLPLSPYRINSRVTGDLATRSYFNNQANDYLTRVR